MFAACVEILSSQRPYSLGISFQHSECCKIAVRARLVLDHNGGVVGHEYSRPECRVTLSVALPGGERPLRDALGRDRFRRRRWEASGQEKQDGGDTPRKTGPQSDLSLIGYWAASPSRSIST